MKTELLMDIDRQLLERMEPDRNEVDIDLELEKADVILETYNRLKVEFNYNKDLIKLAKEKTSMLPKMN